MATDVLILTAPFGSGHTMAAEALAQGFTQTGSHIRVEVVDAAAHSKVLGLTARSYLRLLKMAPALYRTLYQTAAKETGRTTQLLVRQLLAPMRRVLAQYQPRLIVCTHPFPAAALAHLRVRGLCNVPVCSVVTDFEAHPLWVQPGVDRYFVAADTTAESLRRSGAAGIQIAVTGIPIRTGFAGAPRSTNGRRALVLGGSLGMGPMGEVTNLLAQAGLDVTVVCGSNAVLQAHLAATASANVQVLGYTNQMPALMRQADVLVTKPGGLTCAEAMAVGLPMVLTGAVPGHEEENAAALVATGAARMAQTPADVAGAVKALLTDPTAHAAAQQACLQVGRADAAVAVAMELQVLLQRMAEVA